LGKGRGGVKYKGGEERGEGGVGCGGAKMGLHEK